MRNLIVWQVLAVLVVLSQMPSLASDVSAAQPEDIRLAQPVTYHSGYKRLYAVADDLSRITNVTIRIGNDVDDWRVRDIPLFVHVKDMPLGKLLNTVATASHTTLVARVIEEPGGPTRWIYRFYRSAKDQQELTRADDLLLEQQLAEIEWGWDTALWLARTPAAQASYRDKGRNADANIALCKLLASLDASARGKIMAGETVILCLSDSRYTPLISELNTAHWKWVQKMLAHERTIAPQTSEEKDALALSIKLMIGDRGSILTDVRTSLSPGTSGGFTAGFGIGLRDLGHFIEKALGTDLPAAKPRVKGAPDAATERPTDAGLLPLQVNEDEALPALTRKIKLDIPEDVEIPTYADELKAIAEATGLNIVCEDFLSHRCGGPILSAGTSASFEKETTAADLLKKPTEFWDGRNSWFIVKDSNLLVGWASSDRISWRHSHTNLLPEKLVEGLIRKLETGVELDDVTPTAGLTPGQRNDWYWSNARMFWAGEIFPQADEPVWRLYDWLSPSQKDLARSESGFPLGMLDGDQIARFFKDSRKQAEAAARPGEIDTVQSGRMERLFDSSTLSKAVVRIRQVPAVHETDAIGAGSIKNARSFWDPGLHHSYVLEIYTEEEGHKDVIFRSSPKISFPVYSIEREMKLTKKVVPER